MCSSVSRTAGPARLCGVPAVHQISVSWGLQQLGQLRQDYLFNCIKPTVRTPTEEQHVKGLLQNAANSAGPAVSQQHQGLTNGRSFRTTYRACRGSGASPDPKCPCATKCRSIPSQVQRLRSTRIETDQQIN